METTKELTFEDFVKSRKFYTIEELKQTPFGGELMEYGISELGCFCYLDSAYYIEINESGLFMLPLMNEVHASKDLLELEHMFFHEFVKYEYQ